VMELSPEYVPLDGGGTLVFHGQPVAYIKKQTGLCTSVNF
jgi:hypothetical protein